MRHIVLTVVLAAALLLPASALHAQGSVFLNNCELLIMGGGTNYMGDLNNQSVFGSVHPAFSVGLRSKFNNRWALRGELAYGTISSEKDWIEMRNLSFRSRIYELSMTVEFNFRPFGAGATDSWWTPYIFGGLAVFHFNPEAEYITADGSSNWVALQPLHTEGQGSLEYPERKPYTLTQMALPFGVGVKCRLNRTFSFSAQYSFRKTWTDYLDDVSTTYVGKEVLMKTAEDGELAVQLADRSGEVQEGYVNAIGIKRGDDALCDWYSYFNISLGINLETLLGWTQKKRCKL